MKIKIMTLFLLMMFFSFQAYSDGSVSEKESLEGCVEGCECINDSARNEDGKLIREEESIDGDSSGTGPAQNR
jgi:hypothetical protein